MLAARFPRPDVREQIRRLPARAPIPAASPPIAIQGQKEGAPAVPRTSAEMAAISGSHPPSPGSQSLPAANQRRVQLQPLSADRFGVHFTADAELRELIERARALASHRLPKGDLASLIRLMAANFVQREEKRRFGVGARSRRANKTELVGPAAEVTPPGGAPMPPEPTEPKQREAGPAPHDKHSRYLPVAVRRATFARDGGRCAFVSADGRRCNARTFVEFEHVKPFAKAGPADDRNLRLLCKAHNLLHARHCFGVMHIAAKIAARKHSDQ